MVMTIKRTTQLGDKIIRAKAKHVAFPLNKEDKQTVRDLVDTMLSENLVGMAAPQTGMSKQIFVTQRKVTKYRKCEADILRVYINPKITRRSRKKEVGYEGCGSVAEANIFGEVKRAYDIDLEWCSEDGEKQNRTFDGFLARIIQHEVDHLNGVVFADKLHTTDTLMSGSEFMKMKQK
jgi:peptide deformylase